MKVAEVAAKAGYKYSSFYAHIKKADLPFEILARYGTALEYNFRNNFPEMPEFVVNEVPIGYTEKKTQQEWFAEVARLEAANKKLSEELRFIYSKYTALLEEKRREGGENRT